MDDARFEVELFISEVKKFPEIWDSTSREYMDRKKKRKAWFSVCKVFCEDFDQKNPKEKSVIAAMYVKKWKGIRDAYMRSIRKRMEDSSIRKYIYSRHLEFLEKTCTPRQSCPNHSSHAGADVVEESVNVLNDSNVVYVPIEEIEDNINEDYPGVEREDLSTSNRRRTLENFMNFIDTPTHQTVEDDDLSFFKSLLPAVRTLTLNSKLEFRGRVIQLVQEFRSREGHVE